MARLDMNVVMVMKGYGMLEHKNHAATRRRTDPWGNVNLAHQGVMLQT